MPDRRICLRFDVDSHRCIDPGVPALLDLAQRVDAPFTFFVNFGRLTSRPRAARHALRRVARSPEVRRPPAAPKLPLRQKLGGRGLAVATVLNPRVGTNRLDVVKRAADEGHDVGLHGGRNHRVWQDQAPGWRRPRIEREVDWGLDQLAAAGVGPAGFSSPGWSTARVLPEVLAVRSFGYLADRHGPAEGDVRRLTAGIADVPTNMAGEPGGVGWIEWRRALGDDDRRLRQAFCSRLDELADVGRAVLYDHPFHAGIADLAMTERLIEDARRLGWRIATMAELAREADHG